MTLNRIGIVYEMEEKKALVLTPDGEFVVVKRQNHMLKGQQVTFDNKDIYREKKWINKYTAIASAAAAVFIAVFLLLGSFNFNDAYCFISIDINPGFEFSLDSGYRIIEAKAINNDAKILLDSIETDKKLMEDVFLDLIKKSIDFGFINPEKNDVVLVSAALNEKDSGAKRNEDEEKISEFINSMNDLMDGFNEEFNISLKTLKVTAREREEALDNNISMGKYSLYLKIKEMKRDIKIEDVEKMSVSELVGMLDYRAKDEEKMETAEQEGTLQPEREPDAVRTPEQVVTPEVKTPDPVTTHEPEVPPHVSGTPKLPVSQVPDGETEATIEPSPATGSINIPTTPSIQDAASTPDSKYAAKNTLKIQYFCEDSNIEPQTIDYSFRILNTGDSVINLSDVKVRYYFKDDANVPLNLFVYFFSHGSESEIQGEFYDLKGRKSADKYLELRFMTGKIEPGEFVYVQGAFHREDWSRFNQRDDYSFNANANSYVDWERMTAYISDVLVWGIEPD